MNKQRRKEIAQVIALFDEATDLLEHIRDGEQEYADNMPENMQGYDKHTNAEETADQLDSAHELALEAYEVLAALEL